LALVNDDRFSRHRPELEILVGLGQLRQLKTRSRVSNPAQGKMTREASFFFGPSGGSQVVFDIFLQPVEQVTISSTANPDNPRTFAPETTDRLDIKLKALAPVCNIFDYVADLRNFLIFDFSQELQGQVHCFGTDPLDVAFFDVKLALQLPLKVAQGFSYAPVNVYRYEDSHSNISH
jgi:hypothetical protein